MVERPADVLPMDKALPVKMTGFGRLDMTLRKIPGLGIFIVIGLIGEWIRSGSTMLLIGFLATVTWTLAEEYGPSIMRRFTSRPPVAPSEPSA